MKKHRWMKAPERDLFWNCNECDSTAYGTKKPRKGQCFTKHFQGTEMSQFHRIPDVKAGAYIVEWNFHDCEYMSVRNIQDE